MRPITSLGPAPLVQLTAASAVPGVYTAYSWKNVTFVVWLGVATMEALQVFDRGCKARCEQHPEGLSSIHIMVPSGPAMPTLDARAELVRIARQYSAWSAAVGVLLRGAGFWASALRGVLTALAMLFPRSMNMRIFNTSVEIAAWLPELHERRTGVKITVDELLFALQQAEAAGARAAA